jgi:phosphotransferase system  glucose/maltose/N-acetylglucosamine-specific IIC component
MTIVPFLKLVSRVIINPVLSVMFAVATLYFIISVIKLINADGKGRDEAKKAVMWGVVGMFVMVSVYGILSFVLSTFDLPTGTPATSYLKI